jgi:adenosylcobinamide-phosphate synthase
MADYLIPILPLLLGWGADLLFGDPVTLPHPIVWFGKLISFCEHHLNQGTYRKLKGALMGIGLVLLVYVVTYWLIRLCGSVHISLKTALEAILIFYCLAGTTLIREVCEVFRAVDRSLEEGRVQVGRIVGRDTSELSAQEIRTAALETIAENLSDGVIAPLFWYALLGVPGMMAYKMVNTLDSMVGYHSERYLQFGCIPARVDDVANYIPARLTALLMILVSERLDLWKFVWKYGPQHASPNSGYPESALAGILDCRFGGPHYYFGELFDKPYIGNNPRELTTADMEVSVKVNRRAEMAMVVLVVLCLILVS